MKLLIKGGRLIDPKNKVDRQVSLLIENGKVVALLNPRDEPKDVAIEDARGMIVAPGFVDLHTHLREPGFEYKETIESGTKAAAAGGFTSICCMANTHPINDEASVTDFIRQEAKLKGCVNVFPVGALTKGLKGVELAPIGELKEAGCIALSDDGRCVENAQVMRLALEYAKSFDLPVITHSVDPSLSACGVMNEGFISTKLGLPGIPHEAEDVMIHRDILLAQLTGARLHIAHVATKGGVEMIRFAKQKGIRVTSEVTPHHLFLTDEDVGAYRTEAKMSPPLRCQEDTVALIEGLRDGTIDAIATDHAPHAPIDKEVEFEEAENGVIGLETALAMVLNLFCGHGFSLNEIVELLSYKPSKIIGINCGSLEIGSLADIVIFNPQQEGIIDSSWFYSKSRNSPFLGRKVKGRVLTTLVGGKVVYRFKERVL